MKIFDISRALTNNLAPWPGDTPFRFELNWKMQEGSSVNVGKIEMGAHNGTHADAPFHFDPKGETIDAVSLDCYMGDALVVDLTKNFSADARKINVTDIEPRAHELPRAPRLLLKTGAWPDSKVFPKEIPVISAGVPQWLQTSGVKLIGLDVPSVDPIDSKDLANHHALAAAGIAIVESLDLNGIAAGIYHFAALPLKIAGGDAAPVRAILWRD